MRILPQPVKATIVFAGLPGAYGSAHIKKMRTRRKHCLAGFLVLLPMTSARAESPIIERVDNTAFLQIEADSFLALSPKQQALAYWLNQSSIAIDPIIYDQLSRFGLRQKSLLEAVVSNKAKGDPAIYNRVPD